MAVEAKAKKNGNGKSKVKSTTKKAKVGDYAKQTGVKCPVCGRKGDAYHVTVEGEIKVSGLQCSGCKSVIPAKHWKK